MAEKNEVAEVIAREEQAALERAVDRQEVDFLNTRPKEQLNIRIDVYSAFLLDHLAEKYDHSRASMAYALLRAALQDAWKAAKLESPWAEGTEMSAKLWAYVKEDDEE